MPGSKLVNLKTDLKSLKYGHDRQGNGDSGQPYIVATIPSRVSTSPSDDGYIRGGWGLAEKSASNDKVRISKFFNDKPKGPLFISRQIGLQLTNPKLETRTINLTGFGALGDLITTGFNTFNQLLPGPTRLYNSGANTLAQIPVTAFGTHFERHGLSTVQDDNTKYLAVAYNNNKNGNNRLIALKNKLIKPNVDPRSGNVILGTVNAVLGAVNVFNTLIGKGTNPLLPNSPLLKPADLIIDQYSGGPNSKYGVGLTTIRRFDVTSNGFNTKPVQERSAPGVPIINYDSTTGVSDQWSRAAGELSPLVKRRLTHLDNNRPTQAPDYLAQTAIKYPSPIAKDYQAVRDISNNFETTQKYDVQGILQIKSSNNPNFSSYFSKKNQFDLANRVDADLMTISFQAINPFGDVTSGYHFHFPAYIKGFKDNFDATWNEYNYVGRSESFYTYSKFKRNVSFNFDIPCFNKTQLYEKHRALGQLASTTAGAYNTNGLLGGVLLKVKVGGYLNNEYAILNNISYDIPDESSWDLDGTGNTSDESINNRNQLAMYLKVNVSLTIIHTKLPQYQVPENVTNAGFFGHLPNPIAKGYLPAQ
jgi:hypothetical protein